MARVVLAQIEFTLAQISTYVMVIIFHDNSLLSYWNPVPIHDSYQTIRTIASDQQNYRFTIASDHQNYRYTIASELPIHDSIRTTDTR